MTNETTTRIRLEQAGVMQLDQVCYLKGSKLHVAGGSNYALADAEVAWFADAARCAHTRQLAEAQAQWQQEISQYREAVQAVDTHNARLAELRTLLADAQTLGLRDEYARLYNKLRTSGAPQAYPRVPQPPAVSVADKAYFCTGPYVLSRHAVQFNRKDDTLILSYPGHKPLSIKDAEQLLEQFLLGQGIVHQPVAPATPEPTAQVAPQGPSADALRARMKRMEV